MQDYKLYILKEGSIKYKHLQSFKSYSEIIKFLSTASHDKIWYKFHDL